MPALKWMGLILLLLCGAGLGATLLRYERRRYLQAEGYLTLLRTVRLDIDCFSMPVDRILRQCEPRLLADCGVTRPASDMAALLGEARLCLPAEFCRLLRDFAARLGDSYREEQLRCCDYYLARLTPLCDKMRAELPKREKMALLLPVAVAALLALMLL